MNQSSTLVRINLRTKGRTKTAGALIKGSIKDPTTKLSTASIPSNYQTIIYHSHSTQAFGTSQKRFYHENNLNITKNTPTNDKLFIQQQPKVNPSHSKKGYGPFIAKQQRNWIKKREEPGPGTYLHTKSASDDVQREKKKRPCFFRQKKQNIPPKQKGNDLFPGPGQYQIFQNYSANNGWKSSFKTNFKRNNYSLNPKNPGPGYYDLDVSKSPKSIIKEPVKQMQESTHKRIMKMFNRQKSTQNLGPGSYQYQIPNFKPFYESIKNSGNFMISKKDRFSNEKENLDLSQSGIQTPGVYSYKIMSAFDDQKRDLKWPCFKSETKRMIFSEKEKLGPSFVTSKVEYRRNFHFNIKGVWF